MRYEYKILVLDSDDKTDADILNGLGSEGWRVVQAIAGHAACEDENHCYSGEQFARLILERPIAAVKP